MTVRQITKNLLNIIYPIHCYACKKHLDPLSESGLCDFCNSKIRRNPRPYCRDKKFHFERAYSAYLYEDVLKELIHLFKYRGKIAIGRLLANLLINFLKDNLGILRDIDVITFVPLQNGRLRERGFNQSRILAFHISKEYGVMLSDCLKKTRRTRHQNELSRDERLSNLNGVFKIRRNAGGLTGLRILLIDDVMTTGATLNECARILREGGAKEVRCLALARGI